MTDVEFPEGAGLVPQYAVPASDWAIINERAALTVEMQGVASELEQYVPNYPVLLQACTLWRSVTWGALITQAVDTELFGNDAAAVLEQISSDLSGVGPNDPVPASISFLTTVQFQALAKTAGELGGAASKLAGGIAGFVAANRDADASLEKFPLDGWPTIGGPIDSVERAMAGLQQSWGAIVSQLKAPSGGESKITTAGLLASNLSAAISSWDGLAKDARSFVSMASDLESETAP
ncbi:MAG: hypothetical protein FWC87_07035 [Acidimicrobiaceae bacterium]|nr:hypothetical protein [Acidimicrobiaceae bacterium]